MIPEADAPKVFDDFPHWDEDATWDDEELLREEFSDVIWDREISEKLFDERSAPEEVIWDEMPTDHTGQEGFDELPYVAVVWDEELLHSFASRDEAVQRVTLFEEYLVDDSEVV